MNAVAERLRALLGDDAVSEATATDAPPRAAPASQDAVASLLRTASALGWKVRIEGNRTWAAPDAPADVALSTHRLNRVLAVEPQNLVASVEAGVSLERLSQHLAEREVWLALDAPGVPSRTLGSVVATGTAGPLREGFGPIRDHLLGLTCVTGDGRVITAGGRVVKNVAGYDLTRLMTGAFGAFGVIVAVNVRLRTLPRVDRTLLAVGSRDALAQLARDIRAEGARPAALELVSAALAGLPDWCLAARVAGPPTAVDAEAQVVRRVAGDRLRTLETVESHDFWTRAATGLLAGPVTLRIGGLPDALDDLLDLVRHQLGLDERVSATPGAGTIRWTGSTTADRLHHLRRALSEREVPLTLERAPWLIRRSVGHFGAYREGVGPLVSGLRTSFDPGGTLVTAMGDRP